LIAQPRFGSVFRRGAGRPYRCAQTLNALLDEQFPIDRAVPVVAQTEQVGVSPCVGLQPLEDARSRLSPRRSHVESVAKTEARGVETPRYRLIAPLLSLVFPCSPVTPNGVVRSGCSLRCSGPPLGGPASLAGLPLCGAPWRVRPLRYAEDGLTNPAWAVTTGVVDRTRG